MLVTAKIILIAVVIFVVFFVLVTKAISQAKKDLPALTVFKILEFQKMTHAQIDASLKSDSWKPRPVVKKSELSTAQWERQGALCTLEFGDGYDHTFIYEDSDGARISQFKTGIKLFDMKNPYSKDTASRNYEAYWDLHKDQALIIGTPKQSAPPASHLFIMTTSSNLDSLWSTAKYLQ